jgi:hypothetical protein
VKREEDDQSPHVMGLEGGRWDRAVTEAVKSDSWGAAGFYVKEG